MSGGLNTGLDFGHAIRALKNGRRVARVGWNGKGMWLMLLPGSVAATVFAADPSMSLTGISPCIGMKTAGGDFQPGWNASQADMLSEDWEVVS